MRGIDIFFLFPQLWVFDKVKDKKFSGYRRIRHYLHPKFSLGSFNEKNWGVIESQDDKNEDDLWKFIKVRIISEFILGLFQIS